MSELRSVAAFFLGLLFFIFLIGLALGRIRLPSRPATNETKIEKITPTPKLMAEATKKPGLLDRVIGIFKRPTPSLTPAPKQKKTETQSEKTAEEPVTSEKIAPTDSLKAGLKNGQPTKGGVNQIPESGAPTLLLPLSLLLGSWGQYLRRKR